MKYDPYCNVKKPISCIETKIYFNIRNKLAFPIEIMQLLLKFTMKYRNQDLINGRVFITYQYFTFTILRNIQRSIEISNYHKKSTYIFREYINPYID